MHMQSLFAGQFQQYFESMLRRNPLWLFVHIPKTAGSSFNGELVPILSPSYHIFVDYSQVEQRSFTEMLDEAVDKFIAAANAKRYFYTTGHIVSEHVDRIKASLQDVLPITLLRDPVARFVSDFRYQSSPMHPGHEQFRQHHPTIATYMELPEERNKASGALLPKPCATSAPPAPASTICSPPMASSASRNTTPSPSACSPPSRAPPKPQKSSNASTPPPTKPPSP